MARSCTDLAGRIGRAAYVEACCDLLAGAPRERHVEALRALTGFAWGHAVQSLREGDLAWPWLLACVVAILAGRAALTTRSDDREPARVA